MILALVAILGALWLGRLAGEQARKEAYGEPLIVLRPRFNSILCRSRRDFDPITGVALFGSPTKAF